MDSQFTSSSSSSTAAAPSTLRQRMATVIDRLSPGKIMRLSKPRYTTSQPGLKPLSESKMAVAHHCPEQGCSSGNMVASHRPEIHSNTQTMRRYAQQRSDKVPLRVPAAFPFNQNFSQQVFCTFKDNGADDVVEEDLKSFIDDLLKGPPPVLQSTSTVQERKRLAKKQSKTHVPKGSVTFTEKLSSKTGGLLIKKNVKKNEEVRRMLSGSPTSSKDSEKATRGSKAKSLLSLGAFSGNGRHTKKDNAFHQINECVSARDDHVSQESLICPVTVCNEDAWSLRSVSRERFTAWPRGVEYIRSPSSRTGVHNQTLDEIEEERTENSVKSVGEGSGEVGVGDVRDNEELELEEEVEEDYEEEGDEDDEEYEEEEARIERAEALKLSISKRGSLLDCPRLEMIPISSPFFNTYAHEFETGPRMEECRREVGQEQLAEEEDEEDLIEDLDLNSSDHTPGFIHQDSTSTTFESIRTPISSPKNHLTTPTSPRQTDEINHIRSHLQFNNPSSKKFVSEHTFSPTSSPAATSSAIDQQHPNLLSPINGLFIDDPTHLSSSSTGSSHHFRGPGLEMLDSLKVLSELCQRSSAFYYHDHFTPPSSPDLHRDS